VLQQVKVELMSMPESLPGDAILWRYMSFSKLVALFSQQALYFSRCDVFDDPFEAALGQHHDRDQLFGPFQRLENQIVEVLIRNSAYHEAQTPPEETSGHRYTISFTDEQEKAIQARMSDIVNRYGPHKLREKLQEAFGPFATAPVSETLKTQLESTFVSCWHYAPHESEAMWRLYSKDTIEGVSVKTTVGRLMTSLENTEQITIEPVEYRDDYVFKFSTEARSRFFIKRKAFEHEKEVRLAVVNHEAATMNLKGVQMKVDPKKLIEAVVVSPYAPAWFPEVVTQTARKFSLSAPVIPSQLVGKPFHY
jgi:hypothetical protein